METITDSIIASIETPEKGTMKSKKDNGHSTHQPHGFGIRGLSKVYNSGKPGCHAEPGNKFRRLLEIGTDFEPHKFDETDLKSLADAMNGDATIKDGQDPEESHIDAGYTYFGQFVDHDLTFDPQGFAQENRDLAGMVDFRTPRFDLDNVYGRGPSDQPYLYDGLKMMLGDPLSTIQNNTGAQDLPRAGGSGSGSRRAIIGDPRNDENVIVSQLQGVMLRFHNRLVDDLPLNSFDEIQKLVRWHYQWVVIHDFLPQIVRHEVLNEISPWIVDPSKAFKPTYMFKAIREMQPDATFMSVEFSVAAYRLGHSMVRPSYRVNENTPRLPIFNQAMPKLGLNAFGEFNPNWTIDWERFVHLGFSFPNGAPDKRTQKAYKIDTSLVEPLSQLPHSVAGDEANSDPRLFSLAFRNLLRSNVLEMPTGQDVAGYLKTQGVDVETLKDEEIKIGPAEKPDTGKAITEFGDFAGKCPLWVYILAESRKNFYDHGEARLGAVGGRIAGEVFMRLLELDNESFVNAAPGGAAWTPTLMDDGVKFNLAHLIRKALTGLPIHPPIQNNQA